MCVIDYLLPRHTPPEWAPTAAVVDGWVSAVPMALTCCSKKCILSRLSFAWIERVGQLPDSVQLKGVETVCPSPSITAIFPFSHGCAIALIVSRGSGWGRPVFLRFCVEEEEEEIQKSIRDADGRPCKALSVVGSCRCATSNICYGMTRWWPGTCLQSVYGAGASAAVPRCKKDHLWKPARHEPT